MDYYHESWLLSAWETGLFKRDSQVTSNPYIAAIDNYDEIMVYLSKLEASKRDTEIFRLHHLHCLSRRQLAHRYRCTIERIRQILYSVFNELVQYVRRIEV